MNAEAVIFKFRCKYFLRVQTISDDSNQSVNDAKHTLTLPNYFFSVCICVCAHV